MAVIWGLDLREIQWSKFKNSNMWSNTYHLRRTKFIVYQLAMIFCVVSESIGTASLSDYNDERKTVERLDPRARVHNGNFIAVAAFNIFSGIWVATIFGSAFFFDLFWPERKESHSVRVAWKACGVFSIMCTLASAIALTVITVTKRSTVTGVSAAQAAFLVSQYDKASQAPLIYIHNGRAIASFAFAWAGFLATVPATVLLFLSIRNVEVGGGPRSKHARVLPAATGDRDSVSSDDETKDAQPEMAMPPQAATATA